MHAILFGLGIGTSAVGFITIGFGIPVNAFSLGNTLIIAGTIAVVGGFILIALATAVQQINRIAEANALHTASAPAPILPGDSFQPRQPPGLQTSQGLTPQLKPDAVPRVPAPPEPKLSVSPTAEPEQLAWLRPKSTTPTFGEQTLIEEMEASLSPTASPPPPPSSPRLVSVVNPSGEPAVEVNPPSRAEPAVRSAPPVEHPNPGGLFDTVWPEIRPARSPESVARARKPDTPQRDEGKSPKESPRDTLASSPEAPRPVAILKSGTIDGMAYTLYADGSIEAVLASGPIRFASIDALRLHLEKNG